MRRLLGALAAAFLAFAPAAHAASDKPLVIQNGQTKQIPAGDTLETPIPTAANASINLPHGVAPTSPVNGDCWTTTSGLYCYINGGTVGPYATGTVSGCSLSLTVPATFTVSGSPAACNGTLGLSFASQSANLVLASPNGSSGVLSPRALVGADLPNPSSSTLGGVESHAAVSHQWIDSISTLGVPHQSQPADADLSVTNVTTNNVSTSAHGFAPILPNDATKYLDGTGAWSVPAGGGGGGTTNNYYAGALQLISSQTLSSAAASVTFSSIPSGYTDLVVVATARGDTAATTTHLNLQFNGDSGSNYDYQYVSANNTTVSGAANFAQTAISLADMPAATATANVASTWTAQIGAYAGTTFQKAVIVEGGSKWGTSAGNTSVLPLQGWWRSTSAITSLSLTPGAGNFVAGSTFQLYGRGGNNVTINPQPGLPVISETVTSGSQASVTVSGIPSTYRDLLVVVSGRGTTAAGNTDLRIQFNSDTGANYDWFRHYDAGGASVGGDPGLASTYLGGVYLNAASSAANVSSSATMRIYNYANTTFNKSYDGTGNVQNSQSSNQTYVQQASGFWRSTAAINTVKIFLGAGNFIDGSVVTVYGIGGSPTATLPVVPPQGRLTLTSNTPVMTTDATAQTTIYWAPLPGGMLPVGNVMYRPGQITYALNTTAHASGSLYDVFAYNNSGSIALCTGPAWTSSTARNAAISQDAANGVWENTASLTCNLTASTTTTTIAAGNATYLGTFHASAAGQVTWSCLPAAANGGGNGELGLYNAYNQKMMRCHEADTSGGTDYTYNSTTWRKANNNANNRISWVDGLQQSRVAVLNTAMIYSNATSGDAMIGTDLDSTSAAPVITAAGGSTNGSNVFLTAAAANDEFAPQLGYHFAQRMEVEITGTPTFAGSRTSPTGQNNSLSLWIEM